MTFDPRNELKHKWNYLIGILGLADLITCICYLQQHIQIYIKYFHVNQAICYYRTIPALLSVNFGSFCILMVSLDRVIMFKMPLRYFVLTVQQWTYCVLYKVYVTVLYLRYTLLFCYCTVVNKQCSVL